MLNAQEFVGYHMFPADAGRTLADTLMHERPAGWGDEEVVLLWLPPAMLISSFFDAFLTQIHDKQPSLLGTARSTRWVAKFDFQKENIARWMKEFMPAQS